MTNTHARKLRVGLDLDGVMYPFVDSLRNHAVKSLGRHPVDLPEPVAWDFAQSWGMTTEELTELMLDGVDNGDVLLDMDPYPGVAAGLKRLRAAGHSLHIITDRAWLSRRGASAEARTTRWLDKHGLVYDTLHFSADKVGTVPTDVFLEDRPKNYEALAHAGVNVFLRAHPYNAAVRTPPGRRVRDFTSFSARVLRLTA